MKTVDLNITVADLNELDKPHLIELINKLRPKGWKAYTARRAGVCLNAVIYWEKNRTGKSTRIEQTVKEIITEESYIQEVFPKREQ